MEEKEMKLKDVPKDMDIVGMVIKIPGGVKDCG
jgi:hypothetical protein